MTFCQRFEATDLACDTPRLSVSGLLETSGKLACSHRQRRGASEAVEKSGRGNSLVCGGDEVVAEVEQSAPAGSENDLGDRAPYARKSRRSW